MRIRRSSLITSAGASLFAVAVSVDAATVGSAGVSDSFYILEPGVDHLIGQLSGSGSGTLDSSGLFTATLSDRGDFGDPDTGGPIIPVTVTETDTFTGAYSGGTFTVTGGTAVFTNCSSAPGYCSLFDEKMSFEVNASFTLSGGNWGMTGLLIPPGQNFQNNDAPYAYSVGPVSAVPLAPAVWLLGSGLMVLLGTVRSAPWPRSRARLEAAQDLHPAAHRAGCIETSR